MEKMILVNEKMMKEMKKTGKEYLYLLQIGEVKDGMRHIKIGTTNQMLRRMKEHRKKYNENIYVIWCRPLRSKWTTLRKEEDNKNLWKQNHKNWIYQRNDRFWIPEDITGLDISIKKKHHISFDCMCIEY